MIIKLNGQEKEVSSSSSLMDIVHEFCKDPNNVITEINEEIIKKPDWKDASLNAGDRIELINFVGGG